VKHCQWKAIMHAALSVFLLSGIFLAGCATPKQMTVEERVGNRALQWANALMALDYDEALTFMTPSYQNSPRSARFRGDFSGSGFWQDAEIKWVKCDEKSDEKSDSRSSTNDDISAPLNNEPLGSADDCVMSTWDPCGQDFSRPSAVSSAVTGRSDRCVVRLILTVMKPPEMSSPMPIPYELTFLNVDGGWYAFH
jgi:hypothetical protein